MVFDGCGFRSRLGRCRGLNDGVKGPARILEGLTEAFGGCFAFGEIGPGGFDLFDLLVGGTIIILALPVMSIVALAIKLDSPGPILFHQKRVGENGRLFTMFKFRSMVCDAEEMQEQINEVNGKGQIIHKKRHDPRVTRVGSFIRKFSLDELPQFINVLKGDMSLVGPRPELPWLVQEYEPWQRKRFSWHSIILRR